MTKTVEDKIRGGLTEEEALTETSKEMHTEGSNMVKKVYYKPDQSKAIKIAKELGQVLTLKIKNQTKCPSCCTDN